jgi:hypothetical protein
MQEERAKQIARRGITYGPHDPADPTQPAAESGSGIFFMSFQASIEGQFEYIFKRWAGDTDFADIGVGRDPLLPREPGPAQRWPTADGRELRPHQFGRCVTLKGGEYFFAPLISTLRR